MESVRPDDCGTHVDCLYGGCPGCPNGLSPSHLRAIVPGSVADETLQDIGEPDARIPTATHLLLQGAQTLTERGEDRDVGQERSMGRTVDAFNAITGHRLSETEGWKFMVCLKLARAYHPKLNLDDYLDGAAYMALAGECHEEKGA